MTHFVQPYFRYHKNFKKGVRILGTRQKILQWIQELALGKILLSWIFTLQRMFFKTCNVFFYLQSVIFRETLFIRKTCLSDTSCFEIIISHSWKYYFQRYYIEYVYCEFINVILRVIISHQGIYTYYIRCCFDTFSFEIYLSRVK